MKIKQTTRLLTICSTRIRPKWAKIMVDSFNETKNDFTEIVFYVWDEDPFVKEYKELLKDENVIYGPKRFMTEVLNYITTEVYPDIEYYQNINDDHEYLMPDWDRMMLEPLDKNNGWGISYCRGVNAAHNPNAEVMSGKIVKALGYYLYPGFRQFGCEPYMINIGEEFKFFYYIEGDVIAHNCVNIGKMPKDANYEFIYGEDIPYGLGVFIEWEKTKKAIDFKKIREAMK